MDTETLKEFLGWLNHLDGIDIAQMLKNQDHHASAYHNEKYDEFI